MDISQVLMSCHSFLHGRGLGLLIFQKLSLEICHELLILLLTFFLFNLDFLDFFVEICNHHVHHCDRTIALFALLLVGTPCRWRWRWSHLGESCNAGPCDSTGSGRRGQCATHINRNPLFLTEFALWWCF